MKKYRLLKDLPTFKAGEIFKLKGGNLYYYPAENGTENTHWSDKIMAYHHKTLEKFPNILDEWFEEVEEPKNFWFIDEYSPACGVLAKNYNPDFWRYDEYHIDKLKQIGNYFSSKEEAEKAVEKLKAWKRLKDKGLKFKGIIGYDETHFWFPNPNNIEFMFENRETRKDLNLLLFGGEE